MVKRATKEELEEYFKNYKDVPYFYTSAATADVYQGNKDSWLTFFNGNLVLLPYKLRRRATFLAPLEDINLDEVAIATKCRTAYIIGIARVPNYIGYKRYDLVSNIIYDTHKLAHNYDNYLTTRGCSYLNKNERECEFSTIESYIDDCETVLSNWAINNDNKKNYYDRDIRAFNWIGRKDVFSFMAWRNEVPTAFSMYVRHPHERTMALQLFEKSLNYKNQPGGYNETSKWMLIKCSKYLLHNGMTEINAGSPNSYGGDLKRYKDQFKSREIRMPIWKTI